MTPIAPAASGTVLVVDSDEVILRLLRFNLERSGYAVTLARTAAEGLELARENPPDLILSEVHLPDLDGLALCRRLMDSSRTQHIPFLMMSSKRASAEVIAALEGGADDYLVKPLDYREAAARIRAHIRRAQLKPALSPLTSLPGNLMIEQAIRHITTPGHPFFAVLYLDFNHFKAYNDVYGFPAGDEAIRLLARVISRPTAATPSPSASSPRLTGRRPTSTTPATGGGATSPPKTGRA